MENLTAWVPTLIAAGAMGLLWGKISKSNGHLKNDIDRNLKVVTKKFEDVDERISRKLDENRHDLLCENATLKISEHISTEMKLMVDFLHEMDKKLDKLNGK